MPMHSIGNFCDDTSSRDAFVEGIGLWGHFEFDVCEVERLVEFGLVFGSRSNGVDVDFGDAHFHPEKLGDHADRSVVGHFV